MLLVFVTLEVLSHHSLASDVIILPVGLSLVISSSDSGFEIPDAGREIKTNIAVTTKVLIFSTIHHLEYIIKVYRTLRRYNHTLLEQYGHIDHF